MKVLCALALVLLPTLAAAQECEVNCLARLGQAVDVVTESDSGMTGARIYINGQVVLVPWRQEGSLVVFAFPQGFALGTYSFVIGLVTSSGEVKTDPNTLTVVRRRVRFRLP